MKCRYRFCGAELRWGINGNRRYCDDDCNNAERLERERDKYGARKSVLSELKRIEPLLRACYSRYKDTPFDINILRELMMNWSVISDSISRDGIDYRVVGSYGYAAYDNNTIKIIKL